MFSLLSSSVIVLPSSPRHSFITPANGALEDKRVVSNAPATRGLRDGARGRACVRTHRVGCRRYRTAGKVLAGAQEEDLVCYTEGDEADLCGHASQGCSTPASSQSWIVKLMGSSLAVAFTLAQAVMPISIGTSPGSFAGVPAAEAVLFSPDTKVPRTAEVALRRAIPAVNLSVKKIQDSLEEIFYLLRIPQRKPFGTMESNVKRAIQLAKDDKNAILNVLPPEKKELGLEMYNEVTQGKYGLERLLDAIAEKDADKISIRLSNALEKLSEFEILEAPGLAFLLPSQYQEYPRLTGRATVEFVVEKGDGSPFTVAAGGGPKKTAVLEVVLDGYSAPLTSGNFAELVMQGKYNGLKLRSGQQAVLSDNQVDAIGRPIPLEILPAGEFQPLYRTTLDVQDGEIPVLPLSVYGSVAMAHNEAAEDFSSPNQFFFYLYDKRNAGLGGLAFDEGQFSVFGYVTKGRELLSQLKTGDVIQSATMTSGQEKLVLPTINSS